MDYDLQEAEQVKSFLKNLKNEFSFQCYGEKDKEGCHKLGEYYESVVKQVDKAQQVFRHNCDDNNHGQSCYKVGTFMLHNKDGDKEKRNNEAASYFEKGCENGYVPSCHHAGLLYCTNRFGPGKDLKKAMYYLQKSCNEKHSASCYQISAMYIRGSPEYPKNMARAFEYSKIACDMDHIYACVNVSQMYEKGDGVKKDARLAAQFKKKAEGFVAEQKKREKTLPLVK